MTWHKHTTSQKRWDCSGQWESASELSGWSSVDSNISARVGWVPTVFRTDMHTPRRTVRIGELLTFSLGEPRGWHLWICVKWLNGDWIETTQSASYSLFGVSKPNFVLHSHVSGWVRCEQRRQSRKKKKTDNRSVQASSVQKCDSNEGNDYHKTLKPRALSSNHLPLWP